MPFQLKDAIDNPYRPPKDRTRQVLAVSRSVAERLPRLGPVAIISVTAPGRSPAHLDDFERVPRLSFADVDFMNPELSARAKKKLADAFRLEHAEMTRKFVEGLPGEVATVASHCEGGILAIVRDRAGVASVVRLRDRCEASSRS